MPGKRAHTEPLTWGVSFQVYGGSPPPLCPRCAFRKQAGVVVVNTVTLLFLVPTVADAFGTSRRGHARFKELWFPGGQALGNGRNARGLGLRVLPGKGRRRRPRRPPPPSWGSREPGRLSGDAARSRARGRRGGAVARSCRLVPIAVAPALSPATDGRRASRPASSHVGLIRGRRTITLEHFNKT